MGPEDDKIHPNDLYLITKDGHKVPMAATAFCIPNLISADMDEEAKSDDIAFRFHDSYDASFTFEVTDESAKRIRRFCRSNNRYIRRHKQQVKRKLVKEKKYGLLHEET